jgi:hypothetical protein
MSIFFRSERERSAYLAGTNYMFVIDKICTAPLRKTPNSSAMIKTAIDPTGWAAQLLSRLIKKILVLPSLAIIE